MLPNLVHLYAIHTSYIDYVWKYFQTISYTSHVLKDDHNLK